MAVLTVPSTASSREQSFNSAEGFLFANGRISAFASTNALTAGVIYEFLMGVNPGDVITGVSLFCETAASGTAPTLVKAGLSSTGGVMLAQSSDLKASAFAATGIATLTTASYTVPAGTTALYADVLIVGAWSVTQPKFSNLLTVSNTSFGTFPNSGLAPSQQSAGSQTDLPANGNGIPSFTSAENRLYFCGIS